MVSGALHGGRSHRVSWSIHPTQQQVGLRAQKDTQEVNCVSQQVQPFYSLARTSPSTPHREKTLKSKWRFVIVSEGERRGSD